MKKNVLMKALSVLVSLTMLMSPMSAFAEEASADAAEFESVDEVLEESVSQTEDDVVAATATFTEAAGYEEGAYAKWSAVEGATGYKAYYKNGESGAWTAVDAELIREYNSYWRVDVVGIAKNSTVYLKVEATGTDVVMESGALEVGAYDRSGFAFSTASGSKYKKGEGLGAYKDDGTLRDNAVVIYVTNENVNTVTATFTRDKKKQTFTGLNNIIAGRQKSDGGTDPLDIRIIGTLYAKSFASDNAFGSSKEGVQVKGASEYQDMNVTIEGIGEDAGVHDFGFLIRNCSSVEFRNFAVMCCMDDSLSFDTANQNVWVHNMDLFYGSTGGDSDQAKGDGTIDVKGKSKFYTFSYNHFWDSGKSSLCGMGGVGSEEDCYGTYHHNWFDHSDSRHPRIRSMSVHIYNNYYDGVSKYGIGVTNGASAFVEANYFRNTKFPMLSSEQGSDKYSTTKSRTGAGTFSGEDSGIIKSYGNAHAGTYTFIPYGCTEYVLKGELIDHTLGTASTVDFDAYVVSERNEKVPAEVVSYKGGSDYNNFDTTVDTGVAVENIDKATDVPAIVMAKAGRHNGGDFWWNFDDTDADTDYSVGKEFKAAIVDYKPSIVSIGGTACTVSTTEKQGNDRAERSATSNTNGLIFNDNGESAYLASQDIVDTRKIESVFDAADYLKSIGAFDSANSATYGELTTDNKSGAVKGLKSGYTAKTPLENGIFSVNKWTIPSGQMETISILSPQNSTSKTSDMTKAGEFVIDAPGKGTLTVKMGADKDANTSYFVVKNSSGTAIADTAGKTANSFKGKTYASFTYNIPAAGKYTIAYDASKYASYKDTNGQLRVNQVKFVEEVAPAAIKVKYAITDGTDAAPAYTELDVTDAWTIANLLGRVAADKNVILVSVGGEKVKAGELLKADKEYLITYSESDQPGTITVKYAMVKDTDTAEPVFTELVMSNSAMVSALRTKVALGKSVTKVSKDGVVLTNSTLLINGGEYVITYTEASKDSSSSSSVKDSSSSSVKDSSSSSVKDSSSSSVKDSSSSSSVKDSSSSSSVKDSSSSSSAAGSNDTVSSNTIDDTDNTGNTDNTPSAPVIEETKDSENNFNPEVIKKQNSIDTPVTEKLQAVTDDILVSEQGKDFVIKVLDNEDHVKAGVHYITLNAGTKYMLNDTFEIVSAVNGGELKMDVKAEQKLIKKMATVKVNKKKNITTLTLKAVKRAGDYKLLLRNTAAEDKDAAYIYITIENLQLDKKQQVTAGGKIATFLKTVEGKETTMMSAKWTSGKTEIVTLSSDEAQADPTKQTDISKGKVKATAYVDAKTGRVIVTTAEGSKGSIKLTAVMNKKKYNTTIKVVTN